MVLLLNLRLSLLFIFFWCALQPANGQQSVYVFTPDTVTVAASSKYSRASLLRRIFMGNNYREVWNTPVAFPVFDLHALQLTIKEMGGGQQTKSLKLETPTGEDWVLRTIDKNVSGAIPKKYRNKITVGLLQDMISAAHPYAPVIIPALAQATGIVAANPLLFYVPASADLGEYTRYFAGKVCMLERREIIPGNPETESTDHMLDELLFKGYTAIDRKAYLRARLLDMLIADWDRHQDQWRWAEIDSGGFTTLLPLPRDRDQALFLSDGLAVKFASLLGKKQYEGFIGNTDHLTKLNIKSWNLDRLILNGLDRKDWQIILSEFIQDLPDSLINTAVRRLPVPIYKISGPQIAQTLRKRRDDMAVSVMKYYAFVAGNVVLSGTDRPEQIEINSQADRTQVIIRDVQTNYVRLQRYFIPAETQCLHIIAMGGNDHFIINGQLPAGLQLSIDGGTGLNIYKLNTTSSIQKADSDLDAKTYKKILTKQLGLED